MLERLGQLDACGVSDALDFLGLTGATVGIRPLWSCPKIVGRAITVLVGPRLDTAPAQHMLASAIDTAKPGTVLLIANEGDQNVSCWDDIASHAAASKGIRAVAVDGRCRSVDVCQRLGLPVYGRGVVPLAARGRLVHKTVAEPMKFAGISVSPGDYVVADGNGMIVVPAARVYEVIETAERLRSRDLAVIEAIRSGRSMAEALLGVRPDAVSRRQAR